jgi:hypothetical protein
MDMFQDPVMSKYVVIHAFTLSQAALEVELELNVDRPSFCDDEHIREQRRRRNSNEMKS